MQCLMRKTKAIYCNNIVDRTLAIRSYLFSNLLWLMLRVKERPGRGRSPAWWQSSQRKQCPDSYGDGLDVKGKGRVFQPASFMGVLPPPVRCRSSRHLYWLSKYCEFWQPMGNFMPLSAVLIGLVWSRPFQWLHLIMVSKSIGYKGS